MIYLLDVNALVALGFINHEFHARVASWVQSSNSPPLASCSITELGFVRVLAQAPAYRFTVAQARTLLLRLKEVRISRLMFIPDQHDVSYLPGWVKAPNSPGCKWRISCNSCDVAGYATSGSTWQRTQRFGFCKAASDLS